MGQGNQIAPTSSFLQPYYEEAPIHVYNYSIVYNRVISPSIVNQLFLGVNYYNQVFSDADHSFDPVALGLIPASPRKVSLVLRASISPPPGQVQG